IVDSRQSTVDSPSRSTPRLEPTPVVTLAAGGVSPASRGGSLPPRERSGCGRSGERSSLQASRSPGRQKRRSPAPPGRRGGHPPGFRRMGRPDGLLGGSLGKEEENEPDRGRDHAVGKEDSVGGK